jgi:flavin-dependent dehydrogenase
VAGDAAAAADPFLGEGIGQAVLSGRLAARGVIAGDLSLYAREMAATLMRGHAHARLLARLVYGAPGVFQSLARRCPGGTELAWEVLRGQRGYAGIWGGIWEGIRGGPARPPAP